MSALDEPLLQRIGAEILVHDEHRSTRCRESVEPSLEQCVQFGLADLDRGIAPDQVES